MVWVRRRRLGQEERKKGKTTVSFFSGDKVLLEQGLWLPRGWKGAGAPVGLRLHSYDVAARRKPLSTPGAAVSSGVQNIAGGQEP